MTKSEVLSKLKSLGQKKAIDVYEKMGLNTKKYYGVPLTQLKKLAKEVKKNHELALKLWDTGITDAMLLATMIEDPSQVTKEQIEKQIGDIKDPFLVDKYFTNVVGNTPHAMDLTMRLRKSDNQFLKRGAFVNIYNFAKDGPELVDEFFERFLKQIEEEIHAAENWAKEGMLYAIINIGSRNKPLNEKALDLCERIGEVNIDYGDTSCKTPNPVKALTTEKIQRIISENEKGVKSPLSN